VGVLGVLDAPARLLATGFRPKRTVYLAFGHDEEVSGTAGARAIAALLAERNVRLGFVLDEGGAIVSGFLPGLDRPVATIGIAEKGYLSVELSVETKGGHSSIPPSPTAIGELSAAIERLEANPLPARLDTVRHSLDYVGPELPFTLRLALANLWLFGPLVERQLSRSAATNALLRTTTAPTMLRAGVKDNVLPSTAMGVVNFRILPGETVESVLEHVRRAVSDPNVNIRTLPFSSDPSPVSPVEAPGFAAIQRTIGEVFPGAVVTPSLVLGATDARHYAGLSPNVYRFLPIRIGPGDLERIHGTNERIGVKDYASAVDFYARLIQNAAAS
jgi:carboxypeptidase PM20D1